MTSVPVEGAKTVEVPEASDVLQDILNDSDLDFKFDDGELDPLDFYEDSDQEIVNRVLEGELNFDYFIEQHEDSQNPSEGVPSNEEPPRRSTGKKTQSRRRVRKSATKLPAALKGLMGEANLRYARGDKDTAVKICLEIIRQVPTAPEPFQTLAGIYDEMGLKEKAVQMSLVAAHLSPTDAYGWVRLAELSEELGNTKQAITCYTRAIHLEGHNIELHKQRALLLEKVGDKRTAIRGYLRLLNNLEPDQGEYVVSVAKFVAEMCHKENDLDKACGALDVAVEKCPTLINMEFVNLHLEVLLALKNYRRCLEIMVAFCDLVVEAETGFDAETKVESFVVIECIIPQGIPIDILSKLAVVLIHMQASHLVDKILSTILEFEVSEAGELYLDIAEAYIEEKLFNEACSLLHLLVESDSYSLPGVWLKYADCLKELSQWEEAIEAYYKVLQQVQQHNSVRLSLASVLVRVNRQEEAINVLCQTEEGVINPMMLYQRACLLKDYPERLSDYVTAARLLLLRHSIRPQTRAEMTTASMFHNTIRKRRAIQSARLPGTTEEPEFVKDADEPTAEQEWELVKDVCDSCYRNKMFDKLHSLSVMAQLSSFLQPHKSEIDIMTVIAAFLNRDSFSAYNVLRVLLSKDVYNTRLWHLFNLVISRAEDARHHRAVMRLLTQYPDHPALGLLHANNCLVSGTYKYAMHEYNVVFSRKPSALAAFLIAITYVQVAAKRFTSNKACVVAQALGLLAKYREMRGELGTQEYHYNCGRAYQHLGIYHSAIHHYKAALECPPSPLAAQQRNIFDLSREAAYNLHIIYLNSKNTLLARYYLDKYVVI